MPSVFPTLRVTPTAIARSLGGVALFLGTTHALCMVGRLFGHNYMMGLTPLFDLNRELNVPSFFGTLLLVCASVVALLLHRLERQAAIPFARGWLILACGFLFMAYDEAFSVHEQLTDPMRSVLGDRELGIFYFAWVIPMAGVVVLLALLFLPFLRSLPPTMRRRCLLAASLYLGGAFVVEMFEGRWREHHGHDVTFSLFVLFEEESEMAGEILFIWAALEHMRDRYREVRIEFRA